MIGKAEESFRRDYLMASVDPDEPGMNLQQLPTELLRKIFGYDNYDSISKLRHVSKCFNHICQELLTLGFKRMEDYHARCVQRIKVQLPRRESERRNHSLARHADILAAVETRLSLLSMTFNKYIDMGVCCFIPGKVLDEIGSVLRLVDMPPRLNTDLSTNPQPLARPHEVLQELRDISSMAMEYFDDRIAPRLPGRPIIPPFTGILGTSNRSLCDTPRIHKCVVSGKNPADIQCTSSAPTANRPANHISNLQKQLQTSNSNLATYKKELSQLRSSHEHVKGKMIQQAKMIHDQGRKLEDMGRKMIEYDNRQVEILAEVRNILQSAGVAVPTLSFNGGIASMAEEKMLTGETSAAKTDHHKVKADLKEPESKDDKLVVTRKSGRKRTQVTEPIGVSSTTTKGSDDHVKRRRYQ